MTYDSLIVGKMSYPFHYKTASVQNLNQIIFLTVKDHTKLQHLCKHFMGVWYLKFSVAATQNMPAINYLTLPRKVPLEKTGQVWQYSLSSSF